MASELGNMLAELHRLRKFIFDLQTEIDRAPRVLKAHQTKLQKQEEALKLAQDNLKKSQVSLKDKELAIKTAGQQIAKYEKQQNELSEQKQLDALAHQIKHSKATVGTLEDESISLISEIEEHQKKVPPLEAAFKKAKADLATFQAESDDRQARLQGELKQASQELVAEEKKFTGPDRPMYDRLIKSFGAECLARVENFSCSYCHTSVTNQFQHDINGGKFVCCPTCGRGLYVK